MYYNVDITFEDGNTVYRQWDEDMLSMVLDLLYTDPVCRITVSKTDQFDIDRR